MAEVDYSQPYWQVHPGVDYGEAITRGMELKQRRAQQALQEKEFGQRTAEWEQEHAMQQQQQALVASEAGRKFAARQNLSKVLDDVSKQFPNGGEEADKAMARAYLQFGVEAGVPGAFESGITRLLQPKTQPVPRQYIPAGGSIFDTQNETWKTPPTPEKPEDIEGRDWALEGGKWKSVAKAKVAPEKPPFYEQADYKKMADDERDLQKQLREAPKNSRAATEIMRALNSLHADQIQFKQDYEERYGHHQTSAEMGTASGAVQPDSRPINAPPFPKVTAVRPVTAPAAAPVVAPPSASPLPNPKGGSAPSLVPPAAPVAPKLIPASKKKVDAADALLSLIASKNPSKAAGLNVHYRQIIPHGLKVDYPAAVEFVDKYQESDPEFYKKGRALLDQIYAGPEFQ